MLQIELTADGSHTIRNEILGVRYHSMYGAVLESQHVFIDAGLNYKHTNQDQIRILEIGFGTGLNVLLTLRESLAKGYRVHYTALETDPLHADILRKLNYTDIEGLKDFKQSFAAIQNCAWNKEIVIHRDFILQKLHKSVLNIIFTARFDLIYFDAFDPEHQPDLWTLEVFDKLFRACNNGAVLVTYSSKGSVRRALKEAGFQVTKLPGPKGKREMVRAYVQH